MSWPTWLENSGGAITVTNSIKRVFVNAHTLIIAISVSMAALTYQIIWHYVGLKAEKAYAHQAAQFHEMAVQNTTVIRQAINKELDVLFELQNAYSLLERPLDRREFTLLVNQILKRAQGIQALEWIPRIPHAQRKNYESWAVGDGLTDFGIWEKGQNGQAIRSASKAVYYPVYYVAPLSGNETALGFDLYSHSDRKAALEKALETGKMAVSSPIQLVQNKSIHNAILVFIPQNSQNGLATQKEKPNKNLLLGVFKVKEIVTSVFPKGYHPDSIIQLYDTSDTHNTWPLFTVQPESALFDASENLQSTKKTRYGPLTVTADFQVGDRTWQLVIFPSKQLRIEPDPVLPSLSCLIVGLLTFVISYGCLAALSEAKRRRHAELTSQLKAIFDNTYDGILILDNTGTILASNPAFQRIAGYSEAELPGKTLDQFLHSPEKTNHIIQQLAMMGEELDNRITRDVKIKNKRGKRRDMALRLSYIEGASQEKLVGTLYDISRRKQVEALKDHFVSMVNHELRTPLTSIQCSIELMAKDSGNVFTESGQSMIEIARANIRRMVHIINEILDMQKIASGKMHYDFEPLAIHAFIETALAENQVYAGQHGVRFVSEAVNDSVRVLADEMRLMQVMANLLSNAAKFSPKDSVVKVYTELSKDGQRIRVCVRDQGPGIPEDFQTDIFTAFTQATDLKQSDHHSGTGLGLAISKSIIEAHHGQIGFVSSSEHHTVFWFELTVYSES